MSKRKTTTNKYSKYTCAQLVTLIQNGQKRYVLLAKTPAWKTYNGWTPKQQRTILQRELKKVAAVLRAKTLILANVKLKALKLQIARRLGVTVNSSKVTSPAIKRLTLKCRVISNTKNHVTLAKTCSGFKVSSFKNPKATARVTKRYGSASKTSRNKRTVHSYSVKTATITAKHKKQTKTLKKEIQKLKQRNTFMRSQVAKFRRDVAQLQRHYGSLSNHTPKWKVISNKKVGQEVSNIVRFSNALNNAFLKQRAG